ncbi:MAG: Hsp20/alpha crystallin family protein [Candidatus Cloacimonetes bacterium]|nr:Hsp20/alpha crystallin family protein [Candidatus Cloacimonadota bacterium]
MRDKIFDNLMGIQKEMLKILGQVNSLTSNPNAIEDALDNVWHPKCDVFQTDAEWIIIVELAGMEKQNISIVTTDEFIRISGERTLPACNGQMCYYNMEIETGKFERRIYFPMTVIDKDHPKVTYESGVLRIAYALQPIVERVIEIK